MLQTTICFLVKDDQILLAMKKRGHGAGKWNGVGGKAENDETTHQAAIREAEEEIGVTPKRLQRVASITFKFPPERNFNHQSTVYLCDSWQGDPIETEEMKPKWFSKDSIPYKEMWESDSLWLPKVLEGKKIVASVKSGVGDTMDNYKESFVESFDDEE